MQSQPIPFQNYQKHQQLTQGLQGVSGVSFARYPSPQNTLSNNHYKQKIQQCSQKDTQNMQINQNQVMKYQISSPQLNLPVIRLRSGDRLKQTNLSSPSNKYKNKLGEYLKLKKYASIKANNLSYENSPVNIHNLKEIKSYQKLTAISYPHRQRPNIKQIHMQELKKLRQQKVQSVPNKINDKYKNIKPRLMDHEERALPALHSYANRTSFPELESADVLDDYKIISHVGKGCFSVVSSAINKQSMTKCAIKTYTKVDQMENGRLRGIQEEVQNLLSLKHQNIIDLKHAVKDGKKIQLIMENGGQQSLSGLLRKAKNFTETIAKKYFYQIAKALDYCHNNSICHRDLKLENILVDDNGKVKIIDFGFSTKCNSQTKLTTYCGTPPYMSPQIATRVPYNGLASDVWALGVSLYLMLTGKFPFRANNEKQLYRLIQQGKFKATETMSKQAKELLTQMLRVNQKTRINASNIMSSEWLKSPE